MFLFGLPVTFCDGRSEPNHALDTTLGLRPRCVTAGVSLERRFLGGLPTAHASCRFVGSGGGAEYHRTGGVLRGRVLMGGSSRLSWCGNSEANQPLHRTRTLRPRVGWSWGFRVGDRSLSASLGASRAIIRASAIVSLFGMADLCRSAEEMGCRVFRAQRRHQRAWGCLCIPRLAP